MYKSLEEIRSRVESGMLPTQTSLGWSYGAVSVVRQGMSMCLREVALARALKGCGEIVFSWILAKSSLFVLVC